MSRLLIRGARQVLTLRGARRARRGADMRDLAIVENGAVLVEDGRIVDIGSAARIENLRIARDAEELPAVGRVVMPGFIDCSTHLLNNLPAAVPTPRSLDEPAACLRRMLYEGTVLAGASFGAKLSEAALPLALRSLQQWAAAQTVELVLTCVCGPLSPNLLYLIRSEQLAQDLAPAASVVAGGEAAVLAFTKAAIRSRLAVRPPNFSPGSSLDQWADSPSVTVVAPAVQSPPVPVRRLLDLGAAVALSPAAHPRKSGTDSVAALVPVACREFGMDLAEALMSLTLNAAHALGRGETAGSLEPGKWGNVLILNTSDYRDLATAQEGLVEKVVVRGRLVPPRARRASAG